MNMHKPVLNHAQSLAFQGCAKTTQDEELAGSYLHLPQKGGGNKPHKGKNRNTICKINVFTKGETGYNKPLVKSNLVNQIKVGKESRLHNCKKVSSVNY